MTRLSLCAGLLLAVTSMGSPCRGSDLAVLAEEFGRGVHAYYGGQLDVANKHLSAAIDGGSRDPRSFYFRGIVLWQQGNEEAAKEDWTKGSEIEALYGDAVYIGRSLARFQGEPRLVLEGIRKDARMKVLTNQLKRSDQRLAELGVRSVPVTEYRPIAPGPAAKDPFAAGGALGSGAGQAKVESIDAMAGAKQDPFANERSAPAAGGAAPAAAGGDPFGGAGGASPAPADPFGGTGGGAAPADPFAPAGGGGADPFGGSDPFGN